MNRRESLSPQHRAHSHSPSQRIAHSSADGAHRSHASNPYSLSGVDLAAISSGLTKLDPTRLEQVKSDLNERLAALHGSEADDEDGNGIGDYVAQTLRAVGPSSSRRGEMPSAGLLGATVEKHRIRLSKPLSAAEQAEAGGGSGKPAEPATKKRKRTSKAESTSKASAATSKTPGPGKAWRKGLKGCVRQRLSMYPLHTYTVVISTLQVSASGRLKQYVLFA